MTGWKECAVAVNQVGGNNRSWEKKLRSSGRRYRIRRPYYRSGFCPYGTLLKIFSASIKMRSRAATGHANWQRFTQW